MVPVSNAANTTDNAALFPVTTSKIAVAKVPLPKITPAQSKGFLKYLRYNLAVISQHIILNIGNTTLVNIEITLLKLYVSEIYVGIQVVTPSLSIPCKIIAAIIPNIKGEIKIFQLDLLESAETGLVSSL